MVATGRGIRSMTDYSFVDTNILLYASDQGAGEKRLKAAELLRGLWQTRSGVVSTQVLQEFFYSNPIQIV
mgnify:CR=1 FL=1